MSSSQFVTCHVTAYIVSWTGTVRESMNCLNVAFESRPTCKLYGNPNMADLVLK